MLSRPITMQVVDSLATPQGGAIGMSKLVNVERAIYVLVGFTGVSKAAAPIGARAKTILVNGGGVGPDLAGLHAVFLEHHPAGKYRDCRACALADDETDQAYRRDLYR